MEDTTEPDMNFTTYASTKTKSLDSTTINALFSDENALAELLIDPEGSHVPNDYHFESYDPKYSRIRALKKEFNITAENKHKEVIQQYYSITAENIVICEPYS